MNDREVSGTGPIASVPGRSAELASVATLLHEYRACWQRMFGRSAADREKCVSPSIEEFFEKAPERLRAEVLRGLIRVDLWAFGKLGRQVSEAEYRNRFPEFAAEVAAAFRADSDSEDLTMQSTQAWPRPVRGEPGNGAVSEEVMPPKIGRFVVRERLGRGGFGEVYKAYDLTLDRFVAIKLARSDRIAYGGAGFENEGRRLARLRHSNIVTVFEVGRFEGRPFLVSEFIDGGTLNDWAKQQQRSFAEITELVARLADALHYAHLQDCVHRDIKPSNILVDSEGRAYLADFGLATTEREQLHETPATLGTYAYMSPEQAEGRSHVLDNRTDIYSLGTVLYKLLSGRLPFVADTVEQYRRQVIERSPRPPRTVNPHIPPELERICLKCLAKSVDDRFTTAQDLADALRAWSQTESAAAASPSGGSASLSGSAAGVSLGDGLSSSGAMPGRQTSLDIAATPVDHRRMWAMVVVAALIAATVVLGLHLVLTRLIDNRADNVFAVSSVSSPGLSDGTERPVPAVNGSAVPSSPGVATHSTDSRGKPLAAGGRHPAGGPRLLKAHENPPVNPAISNAIAIPLPVEQIAPSEELPEAALSSWSVQDGGRELRLRTIKDLLVKFGSMSPLEERFRLELTFEQVRIYGGFAMVFAIEPVPDRPHMLRGNVIGIEDSGLDTIKLYGYAIEFARTGYIKGVMIRIRQTLPLPRGHQMKFAMVFEKGIPQRISIDGVGDPGTQEALKKWTNLPGARRWYGDFGIWLDRCEASIRNVRINDSPTVFFDGGP